MMDLTIIYLTNNALGEAWTHYHMGVLREAVGGYPVISISRTPLDFGTNLIQDEPPSGWNVYRQLLRGAKLAGTPFIAVAEDDTLYSRAHFTDYRPPMDAVAYNMSRWSVFSWREDPVFSLIRRRGNFAMMGPTALVVEALEERMAAHPNGHPSAGEIGRSDIEQALGVTERSAVDWWSRVPIVNVGHPAGLSPTYIGHPRLRRKQGEVKAYDVPIWGRAKDIVDIFNDGFEYAKSA